MSDTLQEREDQMGEHQVNRSGVCQIPGCPCRGWSAQETAKEVIGTFQQSRTAKYPAKVLAELTAAGELNNEQYQRLRRETVDAEQPAARGGGERVRVELINGVEGQCVAVNDYRICGPKSWGGGSIAQSWTTDKNDILRAFLTPDQKHAWLADDLEVVSVKQYQALVAEREGLREIAKDALRFREEVNGKCGHDQVMTKLCTQCEIRTVLNDQKGPSE